MVHPFLFLSCVLIVAAAIFLTYRRVLKDDRRFSTIITTLWMILIILLYFSITWQGPEPERVKYDVDTEAIMKALDPFNEGIPSWLDRLEE
jgi:hypothetical protein